MSEPTKIDGQMLLPNLAMTIPEILKALESATGRFPREAMVVAIQQREAITPELLRVLETVAADPGAYAKRAEYTLHLFALFLLAQFREQRACQPIIKMVGAQNEVVDDLIGDTITEGLARILGSVYDGNPAPLMGLVENDEVNEFVRSAALDAFIVLEHSGQMPRDEVVGYFRKLFQGTLNREPSFVWDALVSAAAALPAPELLEEVRWAFNMGLTDPSVGGLDDIERDFAEPSSQRREELSVVTDAIGEMEWWAAFDPNEPGPGQFFEPETPPLELPPADYHPPEPFHREMPKIGRNEPCPCGSGKKYKKCCGTG